MSDHFHAYVSAPRPAQERRVLSLGTPASRTSPPTVRATAMVFDDPASRALKDKLDRIAPSDASVLVVGETGTGKELVARYLHEHSPRRTGPFIAVNCGALADTLVEAELFGYEKGAFTGALKTQIGWFEAANGGTLLLDEVGDLPLALQVKLLRVLQEHEVVRLGARTPIPVDVRLVAATNVDLDAAVADGRFREDLLFRLNVAGLTVPPLRDRPGDIPPLAEHFLTLYRTRLGRPGLRFAPPTLTALVGHSWPGNIRELENVVHNAVLLARGTVIEPSDLRLIRSGRPAGNGASTPEEVLRALFEKYLADGEADLYDRVSGLLVRTAFDFANANQVRAAESLGLSRNAFRTHLAHIGVIAARRRRAVAR